MLENHPRSQTGPLAMLLGTQIGLKDLPFCHSLVQFQVTCGSGFQEREALCPVRAQGTVPGDSSRDGCR